MKRTIIEFWKEKINYEKGIKSASALYILNVFVDFIAGKLNKNSAEYMLKNHNYSAQEAQDNFNEALNDFSILSA